MWNIWLGGKRNSFYSGMCLPPSYVEQVSEMQSLGIIVNAMKPRAGVVLERLLQMTDDMGIDIRLSEDALPLIPAGSRSLSDDATVASADVVMALGGDGTMLSAVRRLAAAHSPLPPLIGLNIGSLGFMASVAEKDMQTALRCLRDDDFNVSERSLAACEVFRSGKSILGQHQALNDVVVRNGETSRVVKLEVSIDDSLVTTYVCDGVILSTPTGSTGYSLSAAGPIVAPETAVFVLSVICPHTLSSRPLVVPDRADIQITLCDAQMHGIRIAIDGQDEHSLEPGDVVRVSRSQQTV
jgi:NAD+ kinase